jgi:hypothetical protein
MVKSYREHVKAAEDAVRGVKDKELRKEAFGIILLKVLADVKPGASAGMVAKPGPKRGRGRPRKVRPVGRPPLYKPMKRPGRRGGGVATVAIQKLIDSGSFKTGRDAAGIMKELARKKIILQPSQLRMVLLRFARMGKLKRKIKMKGDKVTYLYTAK